ncbi:MAG: FAD-dependent oxidoreductase, partial [Defluviicoccus sp.]|nr:FAD-dependent oxidoreductase [Defluviicoccus sp.]
MKKHRVDLCVIGAGSGGLSIAAGASQMGASVVLIERDRMGGDCLNVGCVPSKALIAAAGAAEAARGAGRFGIRLAPPEVDFARVHDHVHGTIAAIAPHDSVERFEALGVTVIQEHGRFTGPRTVTAGEHEIEARRFVIATGSSPAAPPIPGLEDVPYLTNETIFERTDLPSPLIVIGGGPIGLELAQAHRRLGAEVTVLEMFAALGKDDPELAEIVVARLRKEGIALREGVGVTKVAAADAGVEVEIEADGRTETLAAAHLLVAAGRRPNIDDLGLESAGIERGKAGLAVDDRLRTTNRRVYAVGDAAGKYQFTHVASYHAGIVIRNALFRLPAKLDDRAVPWVTYTDPELAHVGMTEA